MKKPLFLFLFILTISIFMFDGCVPSKPTEEVELLPSERLLNKLEANRRKIKNFEGTGTISIKAPGFNNSATFRIVLSKPDSVYLTVLGPFGIELAEALVTDKEFVFYDALQNRAYTGAANDDILREIFKIDLSFSDLMDAFVGSVNLTNNLYKQPSKFEVLYDKYHLTYADSLANTVSKYVVDVRNLGIIEYTLVDYNGLPLLEGKYSTFELVENVAVPYHIEVQNKKQNQNVTIDYRKISVNNKSIYVDFKLPPDAELITW